MFLSENITVASFLDLNYRFVCCRGWEKLGRTFVIGNDEFPASLLDLPAVV